MQAALSRLSVAEKQLQADLQGQLAPGVAAEELQQMKGWAAGLSADVRGLWESGDPAALWATLVTN